MEKIKLIADTASDIPDELLREYNIDMPSVPIVVDGKEYFERRSFGIKEFYSVMEGAEEIPVTSRVPVDDFLDCYKRAYGDACTDVICVTINAGGSGTNASALSAREQFYQEVPGAREGFRIHIIDSRTYAMAYGYPVVQAAIMAREGKSVRDILTYLDDWFSRVVILLGCYTLEYARKSGRIGAAAAFVGDILGVRPIISMIDGTTKTIDKIRGEKKLAEKIFTTFKGEPDAKTDGDVLIVCGNDDTPAHEMHTLLKKDLGLDCPIYHAGASIAINAGPHIIAVVYLGKKRPAPSRD